MTCNNYIHKHISKSEGTNLELTLWWSENFVTQRTWQTNKIIIILQMYFNKIGKQQCNGKPLSTWFDQNKFYKFKHVEHKLIVLNIQGSEKKSSK